MINGWNQTLVTAQGPGLALSGAGGANNIGVAPTSLLPGQAKWPLPGQFFQFVGQKLRMTVAGILTTPASPSSVTFSLMFDGIAVFSGGPVVPAANLAGATWRAVIDLDVRAVGPAAALLGIGAVSGALSSLLPATNPVNGNTFDSTLPHMVDLFLTFGAATAGQTIQLLQYEPLSVL